MSTELHRWRKAATTDEWAQLAKLANTTPGYPTRSPTEIAGHLQKWHLLSRKARRIFTAAPVLKESLVFASPRDTAA